MPGFSQGKQNDIVIFIGILSGQVDELLQMAIEPGLSDRPEGRIYKTPVTSGFRSITQPGRPHSRSQIKGSEIGGIEPFFQLSLYEVARFPITLRQAV